MCFHSVVLITFTSHCVIPLAITFHFSQEKNRLKYNQQQIYNRIDSQLLIDNSTYILYSGIKMLYHRCQY